MRAPGTQGEATTWNRPVKLEPAPSCFQLDHCPNLETGPGPDHLGPSLSPTRSLEGTGGRKIGRQPGPVRARAEGAPRNPGRTQPASGPSLFYSKKAKRGGCYSSNVKCKGVGSANDALHGVRLQNVLQGAPLKDALQGVPLQAALPARRASVMHDRH